MVIFRFFVSLFLLFLTSISVAIEPIVVTNISELRTALSSAQSNGQDDIILLESGIYDVTSDSIGTLKFMDDEAYTLTLKAVSSGGAILDGASITRVLDIDSVANVHLEIDGLIIRNGQADEGAAGLQINVKNTLIQNTVFSDHQGSAIDLYGDYSRGEQLTVKHSEFYRTHGSPAIRQSGYYSPLKIISTYFELNHGAIHAGVYYSDASIVNSIFINNTHQGATSSVIMNGGEQEQKVIYNSLFYEDAPAETSDFRVAVQFNSTTRNKIYNSVFIQGASIEATQVFEIHNSYINSANISGSAVKKNLLFDAVDPKFEDPDNLNFALLDGSGLIDNGSITDFDMPQTDFIGNPRLSGDYVDIGPFESLNPTGGSLVLDENTIEGPITVTNITELRNALDLTVVNGRDDTILLADGIYSVADDDMGPIEYFDNEAFKITLKAINPQGAVLDGAGQSRVLEVNSTGATSLILDGLVIQNGFSTQGAAGLQLNVKDTLVIDSLFIDNVGGAIYSYGDYGRYETIKVENSRFLGNKQEPAIRHQGYYSPLEVVSSYFENNDGAIHAGVYYADAFIRNSIFVNNTSAVEEISVYMYGGAEERKEIYNSLFYEWSSDSEDEAKTALRFSGTTKNRVYNSVFLRDAGIDNHGELFELYYSYVDPSLIAGSAFKKGVVFDGINLGYIDQDQFNFSLSDTSDLIDMGFNDNLDLPDTDFVGNPRISGDFVDIGPFESLNPTGGDRIQQPQVSDSPIEVATVAQLRSALTAVAANGQDDIILLADGIYDVTEDAGGTFEYFDNEAFKLTIKALNPQQAILDGGGSERVLDVNSLAATSLELDGLVIQNGADLAGAAGIQLNIKNTLIKNTLFQGHDGSAIFAYGDYGRDEAIIVDNSRFIDNASKPAILHHGYYSTLDVMSSYFENNEGAVHALVNYSRASIQNSIFINNANTEQLTAVYLVGGERAIYNSLFHETNTETNSDTKGAVRMHGGSIYNSIFLDNAGLVVEGEDFNFFHTYIDPEKTTLPQETVLDGIIFDGVNLGFVDQEAFDFRLQDSSEFIDSGLIADIELSNNDFAGNPRIENELVDIGPFESQNISNADISDNASELSKDDSETPSNDENSSENYNESCPSTSGEQTASSDILPNPDVLELVFCSSIKENIPVLDFSVFVSDNFSDALSADLLFWLRDNQQTWISLDRENSDQPFTATFNLHEQANAGTYAIRALNLIDNDGLELSLNEGQLNDLGFDTTTELVNPNSDSITPEVISFSSNGWAIDSDGLPQLNATIVVSDEGSGLDNSRAIVELLSPTGKSIQSSSSISSEGVATFSFTESVYASSGDYVVNTIRLYDLAGNSQMSQDWLGQNSQIFNLLNPNSDSQTPNLVDFKLEATFDNGSDRPVIKISGTANDDLSGVQSVYLRLHRPEGGILDKWITEGSNQSLLNFENEIPLTTNFMPGTYSVGFVMLTDVAGNQISLSETDIQAINGNLSSHINVFFPDNLEVTQPNLDSFYSDDQDLDNDPRTDSYVVASWASLFGHWPGATITNLMTLIFDGVSNDSLELPINFSISSNSAGFDFVGLGCDLAINDAESCPSPSTLSQTQAVYISNIIPNGSKKIVTVTYVSDDEATTGIGINIHFDSTQIILSDANIVLQDSYVGGTVNNDYIFGANATNDQIEAGAGDDYIYTGNGDDIVDAGDGSDLIVGGSGVGDDIYNGGDGADMVTYKSALAPITVNLSENYAQGDDIGYDQLNSIEHIEAGQGSDVIYLDQADNIAYGGSGDDRFYAVPLMGSDELYGELGDDIFEWAIESDGLLNLSGGPGADIFKPSTVANAEQVIVHDFEPSEGDLIDLSDFWLNNPLILAEITSGDAIISEILSIGNSNNIQNLHVEIDETTTGTLISFSTNISEQELASWIDSDGDGVNDAEDVFPMNVAESSDSDLDGVGNNADTDDVDPLNSSAGPAQIVSVIGSPLAVVGQVVSLEVDYDVTDDNSSLTGLGLRVHYNSLLLTFDQFSESLPTDNITLAGPLNDTQDFDNDLTTDKYLTAAWASLFGNWPGTLPKSLVTIDFSVAQVASEVVSTSIGFSSSSNAAGYSFEGASYDLNIVNTTWDFDMNGQVDALTDGLLLLRHMFGLRDASLTNGVVSPDSPLTAAEVELSVESSYSIADIDDNGDVDALTDGLLLLRFLFGLRGENLVGGAIAVDASRTDSADVEAYLQSLIPSI